jgi:hypothetical protein
MSRPQSTRSKAKDKPNAFQIDHHILPYLGAYAAAAKGQRKHAPMFEKLGSGLG